MPPCFSKPISLWRSWTRPCSFFFTPISPSHETRSWCSQVSTLQGRKRSFPRTNFFLVFIPQRNETTVLVPLREGRNISPSQKGRRDLWFPGAFISLAMLPVRPENLQKVYQVSLRIFRFLHQDSCLCKNVNAHAWPGNIKSPASRAPTIWLSGTDYIFQRWSQW